MEEFDVSVNNTTLGRRTTGFDLIVLHMLAQGNSYGFYFSLKVLVTLSPELRICVKVEMVILGSHVPNKPDGFCGHTMLISGRNATLKRKRPFLGSSLNSGEDSSVRRASD